MSQPMVPVTTTNTHVRTTMSTVIVTVTCYVTRNHVAPVLCTAATTNQVPDGTYATDTLISDFAK